MDGGWLASLQLFHLVRPACLLHLPRISFQVASTVVDSWLAKANRKVTKHQRQVLLGSFEGCPSLLYLSLAVEAAKKWRSVSAPADYTLGPDVPALVTAMLQRASVECGPVLLQHGVGILAASSAGLSAREAQDILSCDDEVLDEVFAGRQPPNVGYLRLPPYRWALLCRHLAPLLHQVCARDIFLHVHVADAAAEFVMTDHHEVMDRHQDLADYFDGRWISGKPTSDSVTPVPRLLPPHSPLYGPGGTSLSVRALSELLHACLRCGDLNRLSELCSDVSSVALKLPASGRRYELLGRYLSVLDMLGWDVVGLLKDHLEQLADKPDPLLGAWHEAEAWWAAGELLAAASLYLSGIELMNHALTLVPKSAASAAPVTSGRRESVSVGRVVLSLSAELAGAADYIVDLQRRAEMFGAQREI